ncbi:hypothetical protein [Tenacibaculum ovolyticum]|uniref:hypothetical protein n=1 Tax=Tenacibaculum ovolyticum TaxID=104270 RepID=UPI0003F54523|nr:hypothetical protein [Tenacibaculum ovolyticum]
MSIDTNKRYRNFLIKRINRIFSRAIKIKSVELPNEIVEDVQALNVGESFPLNKLIFIKGKLEAIVASNRKSIFGNVNGLFKTEETTKASIIAAIFLVLFVSLAVLDSINEKSSQVTILDSSGYMLLYNLMFSIVIAGLGTSFRLLHSLISEKIKFFRVEYLIEGIFSGFILSEILYINIPEIQTSKIYFGKFLFAFFGGMISGILYSVIERITSSLGILITGSDIQEDQYKEKNKDTQKQ